MAPRGPANKPRDYDYSNVGKAGRRTGITLKEGKLDEHGMEELDGMFSSPEKSPVKDGYANNNDTILNSEDMEMGNSSIPDPAEVLSGRRGQWGNYVPPPRSRSPIKSNMNGTPRRTPGIRSSPIPHSDQSSSPTSSRAAAKRSLDFSRSPALRKSLLGKARATTSPSRPMGLQRKGKDKAVVEEEAEDSAVSSDGEEGQFSEESEDNANESDEPESAVQDQGDYDNDAEDASSQPQLPDGDELPVDLDDQSDVPPSPPTGESSRGKKRKNAIPNVAEGTPGGRKAKGHTPARDSDPEPNPGPPKKRRGRPAKKAVAEAHRDEEDDAQDSRPAKKPKTSRPKPQGNLQMSAQQEEDLDKVVENINNRNGPLKGRSLYILKKELPSQEGTVHTRSGRASVRPLAYWRNERCVYGDGEAEVGERFPLSTIKEIIRTEDPEPDKNGPTKRKASKKTKKTKAQKNRDDESEDEDMDNADPWENETGILHGYIRKWDPELNSAVDEEEILDIAYAPSAIETREVKGATFRFAKLLSTSFIGSGVVEMPPGGVKKPKNSKKMHMVFFVFRGRVQVDISGVQFSVGKGGVFQVPRGNSYSFANAYEKPASLFFTQGCVPSDTDGSINAGDSGGGEPATSTAAEPTSTSAVPPSEEAEPAPKKASTRGTGKGRGRGRGRGRGK